jgi:hypothetical protein
MALDVGMVPLRGTSFSSASQRPIDPRIQRGPKVPRHPSSTSDEVLGTTEHDSEKRKVHFSEKIMLL